MKESSGDQTERPEKKDKSGKSGKSAGLPEATEPKGTAHFAALAEKAKSRGAEALRTKKR